MTFSKQLSAAGHPGYGDEFARLALEYAEATGANYHIAIQAVYQMYPHIERISSEKTQQ